MKKLLYIFVFLILLVSCQKTVDCISGAGDDAILKYELNDFDTLSVNDNFEITLIQDTFNELIVKARRKYAESTVFNINNNTLFLSNDYKCKFTKPGKNKINIELHIDEISLIRINEASKIVSSNTLKNNDEIGAVISTKYADIDLDVESRVFYFWNTHLNGGKMFLKGKTGILKLWNTSLFAVDASDMNSDSVYVDNSSKGDIKINVNEYLDCKISGSGNVFYKGNPRIITVNDTLSSGKLIKTD